MKHTQKANQQKGDKGKGKGWRGEIMETRKMGEDTCLLAAGKGKRLRRKSRMGPLSNKAFVTWGVRAKRFSEKGIKHAN